MTLERLRWTPREHDWWPRLWQWLHEHPSANLDDYGPQSYEDFVHEMNRRVEREYLWGVRHDEQPIGVIGYLPITPRLGTLHGICFAQAVHGTGLARAAFQEVLASQELKPVEKIQASFFAHNTRVAMFLQSCGFEDEGVLRAQTLQHGRPIDMRLMALMRKVN